LAGHRKIALTLALMILPGGLVVDSVAQGVNVTGRIAYYGSANLPRGVSAVVWLVPMGQQANNTPAPQPLDAVLRQKNKAFEPHLLVVTKGSTVQFPNLDPWFHNVFSLFNGKKFDLGLYEAGTTRTVHFDREGVSYIFCNIHPEMSAVVVVVPSRYYAAATKDGEFSITGVPPGRYMLHVWSENSLPESLEALSREVELSGTMHSVGAIRVRATDTANTQHKNKYGQEYEPPSPSNPVYTQP
jgi:plastocyanin